MSLENNAEVQFFHQRIHAFLEHIDALARQNGMVGVFAAGIRFHVSGSNEPQYVVGGLASGVMHLPRKEFDPLMLALSEQSGIVVQKASATAYATPEARA